VSHFLVGQRVIVTRWAPPRHLQSAPGMNGYYGFVSEQHPLTWREDPMVSVSLKGRVGHPPREFDLDPLGDDPWVFYERELEAAD
jgi:hypothetical protein